MASLRPAALRRFRTHTHGAAAIEFAIILPFFFGLTLATVEAGWTMTKVMLMESAVDKAVRDLRIGKEGGFTHDELVERVCEKTLLFDSCAQSLRVELVPARNLAAMPDRDTRCVDTHEPDGDGLLVTGASSDIVMLRACLLTEPLTPGLGYGLRLPVNDDGKFAVIVTSVYLNE